MSFNSAHFYTLLISFFYIIGGSAREFNSVLALLCQNNRQTVSSILSTVLSLSEIASVFSKKAQKTDGINDALRDSI